MYSMIITNIGVVTHWKCHQQLDKIFIFFFTHTTSEISAKLFLKKTLSCNTPAKLNAIMFAQHMLAVMQAFHTVYAYYKCTRF